ncbi:MAG: Flp pilus assembly complex ATPase component TadA [Actinomycetia bacterium]|nr:Flp pilus assembly complex ATPase component TadA [Actinomycetes bacterium]
MKTPLSASRKTVAGAARPTGGQALPSPRHERTMRRRLGEVLVSHGVIDETQLDELLAEQAALRPADGVGRLRLGHLVVARALGTEEQVAEALGDLLALDVVDLSTEPVDPTVAQLIPRSMAERFGLIVLAREATGLRLAASDPTNVLALDDVRIHTRERSLHVVVATPTQIAVQIKRVWSIGDDAADAVQLLSIEHDESDDDDDNADQTPTVRLLDALLGDAVRGGASDIHVEPQRDAVRIRYRIDGLLRDMMTVPRNAGPSMISRLKIISGLDISERRIPQDGRTRISVDGTAIDARVSTLPAIHGEKVVIRLLTTTEHVPGLDSIGLLPEQLDTLQRSLNVSQGLILITGPTGSGKTNTLYAAISQVITPERNVVTLEDPVEIQLPGITQVNVNLRSGMTFATGLRAILRQDPDVILVGEIRDKETAELALRASLTGHLVLSTVHTNGAAQALTRLVDMEIPPFLVASSLNLVVAQRLLRCICGGCSEPHEPSDDILASLSVDRATLVGANPRRGTGCLKCGMTGYRGRLGAFEVLPVTAGVRRAFAHDPTEQTLLDSDHFITLQEAALRHAASGRTTFEEVLRVTQVDAPQLG